MEALQRHKWRLIAIGGACAATATLVTVLLVRKKKDSKAAPKKGSPTAKSKMGYKVPKPVSKGDAAAGSKNQKAASLTRESLPGWLATLQKKDADELPKVLEWTDRLLKEKPRDNKTLGLCLSLMQHWVEGNKMCSQVSAVALKAKDVDAEKALEILVNLFKDRRHRGYEADSSVINHAVSIIDDGIKGKSPRACYQRACRLLYFLAMEANNRAKIRKASGLEKVLQLMEKVPDDHGVLLESCGFLKVLAGDKSFPENQVLRAYSAAIGCLAEVHRTNGELQWRALAVIHILPGMPPDEMKVAELAVAAAKQHPGFDGVVEWVAKLLHRFCKVKGSEVKTWLKSPACQAWLEEFRESPSNIKKQNKEADHWVAELCRLCK